LHVIGGSNNLRESSEPAVFISEFRFGTTERVLHFVRQRGASMTLLSRIIDLVRECRPAKGTAPGRSQQPRPDRFQDLLQRQTRSFFLPQGKLSGGIGRQWSSSQDGDEIPAKSVPRNDLI